MSTNELILAVVVGVPIIFAIGRFSTRITWFHARAEEKFTLPEFVRGRR